LKEGIIVQNGLKRVGYFSDHANGYENFELELKDIKFEKLQNKKAC